jgi:Nucleotide-diphospho-sugar transferase
LSPSAPAPVAAVSAAAPSHPDGRRLVLGAAIGFDVEQVRVFIESLRAHYAGDVLLLIRWPGLRLARYLKSRGVDAIRVFQTRSFTRSVHARRYAIYLSYLRARLPRYDQVMMSDVRDVVFQRNPFDGIASPKCHFYLESAARTIGEDPTNARWVRGCFSAAEAERLASCRISCSGITIGGTAAIIAYLEQMVTRIRGMPWRIYREIGHGYDQAIHNYLVHLGAEIDGIVVENNQHIATMALEPRAFYRLNRESLIYGPDDHLFPICHQYDRFPDLRKAVEARFASPA